MSRAAAPIVIRTTGVEDPRPIVTTTPSHAAQKTTATRTKAPSAATRQTRAKPATAKPKAPKRATQADEVLILASGVFVGGTAPLLPGARYAIGIHEGDLKILGPMDQMPDRIVVSKKLAGLQISALSDRLVISEASRNRISLGLVFSSIGGRSAEDLEAILTAQVPDDEGRRSDRAG
jgi:hypothetical protein